MAPNAMTAAPAANAPFMDLLPDGFHAFRTLFHADFFILVISIAPRLARSAAPFYHKCNLPPERRKEPRTLDYAVKGSLLFISITIKQVRTMELHPYPRFSL